MKNICSIPAWRSLHNGRSARVEPVRLALLDPLAAGIELADGTDSGHMTE